MRQITHHTIQKTIYSNHFLRSLTLISFLLTPLFARAESSSPESNPIQVTGAEYGKRDAAAGPRIDPSRRDTLAISLPINLDKNVSILPQISRTDYGKQVVDEAEGNINEQQVYSATVSVNYGF